MPTTSHTVTLEINGSDYTSLLKRESLYVRHSIGNENGVCDFTIEDDGTYRPQGWDSPVVKVNGTAIFGGYIFQHDGEVLGTGATAETQWQVQCKDWSILLDMIIVEFEFREQSDASILDTLFGFYLPGDGFDVSTNVDTLNSDIDIAFQRVTLREALNMLAARVDAQWYIAPDKKLSWKAASGFPAATFNIDTVSPNGSTTHNVAFGSLRRQVDESTIINRVTVIGGNSKSGSRQTDTFEADGTTDTFGILTKEPHSIWKVDYWINGGRYIRYTTNIGYEPGDKLFAEDGGYEIVCNLELQTVRIRHIDGSVPDNGTDVVIDYYYQEPVTTTVEHTGSQAYYSRIFTQHVYNQELTSLAAATEYGNSVLAKQAFGRETITFDLYEYGLQPGTRVTINAPTLALGTTVTAGDLALEYNITDGGFLTARDGLLWENADDATIENYGGTIRYVVQEVQYQPVLSGTAYMMVAKVSVGDWQHTLIDALQQIGAAATGGGALSSGSGRTSNVPGRGKLSNFANDLGDIAAGRAIFTDGGTGIFDWDNYAGHTGVVAGLEDNTEFARGVVYILDSGTVKAKLGRMTGLSAVGTVTPTGWGLWTNNGYFTGVVAASEIIGGTITGGTITGGLVQGGTVSGALVSGGTVSGALLTGGTLIATIGTIGGFRIENNKLWSDGGTIATGSIVNSSNPGVYLNSLGLFGFGTLGMTFKIPTNPAEAPWFSSGTINNVVYEVYESAILRTSANPFADGGIQMDNSGLFGINPQTGYGALLLEDGDLLLAENGYELAFAGLNFMLDTQTGLIQADGGHFTGAIYATEGRFSGLVEASRITGGTISGAVIEGFTVSGQNFVGVTITASSIVGGTIAGAVVTGGLFSGGTVSGGTVSAARFEGGTVSGGLISGGTVSSGRFEGGTITGALVAANTFQGGTVSAAIITASAIQGNNVTGGTVSGALLTGGTITSPNLFSLAGGSIVMGTAYGIQFNTANTGPSDDIIWRNGGSIIAQVMAYQDGNSKTLHLQSYAYFASSDVGEVKIWAYKNGAPNSTLNLGGDWSNFTHSSGGNVTVGGGTAQLSGSRAVVTGSGTAHVSVDTNFNQGLSVTTNKTTVYSSAGTVEVSAPNVHILRSGLSGTIGIFSNTNLDRGFRVDTNNVTIIDGTAGYSLVLGAVGLTANTHIQPGGTAYTLGKGTAGWTYIYMRSPDNTVWRLEVDNSGNLVIT